MKLNLGYRRDWGHAKDYVRAMHMMMQHHEPEDFVIATGVTNSVEDVYKYVFNSFGLNYKDYVVIDPKYFRPKKLEYLKGSAEKA
jgi:GDPmannose 4,6-dehydratase